MSEVVDPGRIYKCERHGLIAALMPCEFCEAAPKAAASYLDLTGIKGVQMEENRRLSEEMEAARPADPREAEPSRLELKRKVIDLLDSYYRERMRTPDKATRATQDSIMADTIFAIGEALAPESQPHTVHPWDALRNRIIEIRDFGNLSYKDADSLLALLPLGVRP